jgi:hypothetical protein
VGGGEEAAFRREGGGGGRVTKTNKVTEGVTDTRQPHVEGGIAGVEEDSRVSKEAVACSPYGVIGRPMIVRYRLASRRRHRGCAGYNDLCYSTSYGTRKYHW